MVTYTHKSMGLYIQVYGTRVCIYTNHQPLVYMNNLPLINNRVARTVGELNTIDHELVYLPGHLNEVADALSRIASLDTVRDPKLGTPELPPGFQIVPEEGGGDSLFRALSRSLFGGPDQHVEPVF